MKKWLLIGSLVFLAVLSSCASRKDLVYFQGNAQPTTVYEQAVPKIQTNDMLAITVSASNIKATEPFNQINAYQRASASQPGGQNIFTVNEDGTIDYPIIGKVKLTGLTRDEAALILKTKLSDYIVDPGVNISFTNFKVSVIGEVKSPGTFTLPSERITLLEALALAGDLTIQGKRENVMVIREVDGVKKTFMVDLTKREALDSPVYYLAQNDVVYVEPNKAKIQSSVVNYSLFISVAGIIISVLSVVSRK